MGTRKKTTQALRQQLQNRRTLRGTHVYLTVAAVLQNQGDSVLGSIAWEVQKFSCSLFFV